MRDEQLSAPRPPRSLFFGGAPCEHTAPVKPTVLMDLSIPDDQVEPEHLHFRAWVTIPVAVPDRVSALGVVRAVNSKLAGRDPLTFVRPAKDAVVTNFSIYDVGVSCRREVNEFATSLNEVLRPMTVSDPCVQYHFAGNPIEDHIPH